ncbi:reverse transcriptase domain-containing protein [Tanacetum coccineum]
MALALRHVSRRLRRYFEAHPITVITDQPIKQVLNKADTSGRLAPYSLELAAYNITYEPRSAIKGQILTDFINEVPMGSEAMVPQQTQYTVDHDKDRKEECVLYTDGAASAKVSGAGLVLISPTKTEYTYALRLNFESTNNQAEYEALLADVLSKLASVAFNHLTKEILVETLDVPSMDVEEINVVVDEEGETWMTPIINYLEKGIWPEDQNEAGALQMKINQYVIEEGVLFKISYLMPMLRGKGHPARILLTNNAPGCKRRNTQVRLMPDPLPNPPVAQNTNDLNHAPWPFFQWGMDVLGLLPEALGKAHRTSLKTSNWETPYSLTFGSEALIPIEIGMPTQQMMMIKEGNGNEEKIRLNLDLLTERREAAAIREARYKMKMEQYYNKRVSPTSFKVGEYVYRKNEASRVENLGKLGPKWEGPYLIVKAYQNGSYKLRTMNDREVPSVWLLPALRERQFSSYIT